MAPIPLHYGVNFSISIVSKGTLDLQLTSIVGHPGDSSDHKGPWRNGSAVDF